MTTLYTEKEILEDIALFSEEFPHWHKVITSGLPVYVNINDSDLEEKLLDPEDPIFMAYNASATMELPVALDTYFTNIKTDLTQIVDKPKSIFLLDIEDNLALNVRKDYGMAVYSTSNLPESIFTFAFSLDLEKAQTIDTNWKGILSFEKPLSNSLIITDNYFFNNEDNNLNRGFSNLVNFLDAYLPNKLAIDYHVTIFAEDNDRTNEWWIKEYGKLVALIKPLREFEINLELVLGSTIHRRRLISNYVFGKTDQGYDVFHAKKIEDVRFDNEFEHFEIFSNLDNLGTKYFQASDNTIIKLEKISNSVCEYVSVNGNSSGRMLFGCNKNKTIKNRLLN
ncbi:hypothetical protein [Tenacibaculum sp. M341]|uniref:hypothetical protein n=1 Tax=Tenacibaculum sp. M341 TaxID=2530339 RepID=UPI00104DD771|nr:hypothetical protein [Tenacibaculum sp. M341]TCI85312.1 hypothetical protein EYW44_17210 [Tenacibaculum sp. M341]